MAYACGAARAQKTDTDGRRDGNRTGEANCPRQERVSDDTLIDISQDEREEAMAAFWPPEDARHGLLVRTNEHCFGRSAVE